MTKPKNPVKKTNLKTDKKVKVKPLKLSSRGLMKQKLDMSLDDLFVELGTKKPRKTTKKASTKKSPWKSPLIVKEYRDDSYLTISGLTSSDLFAVPVTPKLSLLGKLKRLVKRVLRLGR